MNNKLEFPHFILLGAYFGYPECCTEEFCDNPLMLKRDNIRARVGNHTGFIPCAKHAQQILDGDITLESLIKDRICKSKFPEPGEQMHTDRYMADLVGAPGVHEGKKEWMWMSFSYKGLNRGGCMVETYSKYNAIFLTKELGIQPDYDDLETLWLKEEVSELEPYKLYSREDLLDMEIMEEESNH